MIGSYFREVASRFTSLQKSSYRRVGNCLDETLDSDEKQDPILVPQTTHWRPWIITSLFLGILTLVAFSVYFVLGDATTKASFSPNLKVHSVVFELDDLFAQPPSEDSNAAWDSLIPDGHGYVIVPDASERYGLKPGISTEGGNDRYSVALYHQIHCLGVIRIMFYEMVLFGNQTAGLGKRQSMLPPDSHRSESHAGQSQQGYHGGEEAEQIQDPIADHVEHCFDYLRQSLMCAGDMTIEHAREPPLGEKRETTDGWGVEHQCKDWNEMVNWTLDHKANHSFKGILG